MERKIRIPEYLLAKPITESLSGEEMKDVYLKFINKTPVETRESLHVVEKIYVDEDGTRYHFYYSEYSETPLIEKEISNK